MFVVKINVIVNPRENDVSFLISIDVSVSDVCIFLCSRSQSTVNREGGDDEGAQVTLSKSDVVLTFQLEVLV